MYVCMVITYSKGIRIKRVRLPILLVVIAEQGKLIFPCPRSRRRIWSSETGSAVTSRVSLFISILRLNLVLTYGIPPEFRGGVLYAIIGSAPSLSDHAIGASKPQGSSKRVQPWQVTHVLSHTHFWHEVGMLKGRCPLLATFLSVFLPLDFPASFFSERTPGLIRFGSLYLVTTAGFVADRLIM